MCPGLKTLSTFMARRNQRLLLPSQCLRIAPEYQRFQIRLPLTGPRDRLVHSNVAGRVDRPEKRSTPQHPEFLRNELSE